jgi:glutamyl-tRNA synthetase
LCELFRTNAEADALALESAFKELAMACAIKPGELQLPLRIMLVGGKFGPPVFEIVTMLGIEKAIKRIGNFLIAISE